MQRIFGNMLFACILMGSCAQDNDNQNSNSNNTGNSQRRVFFEQPKDGATVSSPVAVKFGSTGLTVEPAGEAKPNAGHFHVLIDNARGYIPKNQVIPSDDAHVHFGDGGKQFTLMLSPGKHTLTLQFGNGQHQSGGKELSHTITITVK
ncbi:MAG: DUF4399 domain-containing protein [Myxococcota bacterium]